MANKAKTPTRGALAFAPFEACSAGQLPDESGSQPGALAAPVLINISAVSRAHLAGWGRVPVAFFLGVRPPHRTSHACADMRPLPIQWLPTCKTCLLVDLRD